MSSYSPFYAVGQTLLRVTAYLRVTVASVCKGCNPHRWKWIFHDQEMRWYHNKFNSFIFRICAGHVRKLDLNSWILMCFCTLLIWWMAVILIVAIVVTWGHNWPLTSGRENGTRYAWLENDDIKACCVYVCCLVTFPDTTAITVFWQVHDLLVSVVKSGGKGGKGRKCVAV